PAHSLLLYSYARPRALPSFPTRRSSDLATTQPYATVMPPSSNASATTARGPARRGAPLPATGRREALGPHVGRERRGKDHGAVRDRKSTRLNSSHVAISYAVFCLKKKKN